MTNKTSNNWQVYPVNDTREHLTEETEVCWCNPKMEVQANGAIVFVHNSEDGRELSEPDYKKLIKE